MDTWFTSDIHRSHKNIIKYSNRPFENVDKMNQHILDSWRTIKDGETLYSLGDFAFENIEKTIGFLEATGSRRINLIMITGNHDNLLIDNYKGELTIAGKNLIDSGLVKKIVPYLETTIERQNIILFHYGCRVWNKSHHGSWLCYGHSHGTLPPRGKSVDVGLDAPFITGKPEYRPFSFKEIKTFMDKQEIYFEDKHGEARR